MLIIDARVARMALQTIPNVSANPVLLFAIRISCETKRAFFLAGRWVPRGIAGCAFCIVFLGVVIVSRNRTAVGDLGIAGVGAVVVAETVVAFGELIALIFIIKIWLFGTTATLQQNTSRCSK